MNFWMLVDVAYFIFVLVSLGFILMKEIEDVRDRHK
jgi:hypothetical protein